MEKRFIKRPEIVAFLNTKPLENTPFWSIVGDGMTTGTYSYEAQKTTETYIINENASNIIDSYSVSIDGEMKAIKGDEVYDYINELRYKLAKGTDAETTILLVDKYDVDGEDNYKAQIFNCTISISSYGGDGGATPTIGFTVDLNGDPTNGKVTIENGTPTFTPIV